MLIKLDYIYFFLNMKENSNIIYYIKLKMSLITIFSCLYKFLISCIIKNNSIHIFINKVDNIKVLQFLKYNSFFFCKQLIDFTVVDLLEMPLKQNDRFEFVYMLLSVKYNLRIFVRGLLSLFDSLLSSTGLYNSAMWLEREIWDMFGIFFVNNLDLRRILTDYGFNGYPFRKDFPLSGYVEVRYDDIKKIVVLEPLELSQEYRFFRLDTAWQSF